MLLKDRTELEELRGKAGKTDEALAKERLSELEDELKLDGKEVKVYVKELFLKDAVEQMGWLDRLTWILTGLHQDLVAINEQAMLNALKGAGQEEIKELRDKRVAREKDRLTKEDEKVKLQVEMGILPAGSVEHLKKMRERSEEYAVHPESLEELSTKFVKLNDKQLSQKREYITFRIKEREEEVNELRNVTEARQKAHAAEVLQRIKPAEYGI